MSSKEAVTLALTLLLLSSCTFITFNSTVIDKRGGHIINSDHVSLENKDLRTRFAAGNGSVENPYQISNVSDLQSMNMNLSANYMLINNIDASETRQWNDGKGFSPVANDTDTGDVFFDGTSFTGSFDGQGYTISDLYINRPSESHIGLFGYVGNSASITNTTLINDVTGFYYTGGLVGWNKGSIKNCDSIGHVGGDWYIGGLIGRNDNGGTVKDCYSMADVIGNKIVGGIVGYNDDSVEHCFATGNVDGNRYVGGLIGDNWDGHVIACYSTGNISGESRVGGLIGQNYDNAIVENCYSTGNVIGSGYNIAGLVGFNCGKVTNCYATNTVSGDVYVGGLVGSNTLGIIEDSYAIGDVTGRRDVGGLVGDYFQESIENSFYSINITTINGGNYITPYGIYGEQFNDWRDNSKTLDIDDYLVNVHSTDYYNITNPSDMKNMLPFIASGDNKFKQTRNIDLSYNPNFYMPVFKKGEYDGAGYSISNLNASTLNNSKMGLFGFVGSGSNIVNVSLINNNVKGYDEVGGLVGYNNGTIENCDSIGKVTGDDYCGGLVGYNDGTLGNCYSMGEVIGNNWFVGGLAGINLGTIQNCFSKSKVTGDKSYVGGLVGRNFGPLENCYASGNVTGRDYFGGLAGGNTDTVQNCYSTGDVSGTDWFGGGLVGSNGGTIKSCFSKSRVTGDKSNVGGFVGGNYELLENCYAIGNVTGETRIGGFVGMNKGSVRNCYATGKVNSDDIVGGLVALNDGGNIENSYWDMETTGQSESDGGSGKTTAEMVSKSNFISSNWDFEEIWGIANHISYPFLQTFYYQPAILTQDVESAVEDIAYNVTYKATVSELPGAINSATFSIDTNADWLSITPDGVLTGMPEDDDVGKYRVTVTAVDLANGEDFHNFDLIVMNINDPPTILTTNVLTVAEDEYYIVDYRAFDVDSISDNLTWQLSTNATWLIINATNGWLNGTPTNSDIGSYWVNVSISDNLYLGNFTNFTLSVVNIPPTITTTPNYIATEDEFYYYNINSSDDGQGTITWNLIENSSWLSINTTTGELYGTPTNDEVGQHVITVSVNDGNGGIHWYTIIITVKNVNDLPSFNATPVAVAVDGDDYFSWFNATDEDSIDKLTWSMTTNATWLDMKSKTGYLSGVAETGIFSVNIAVSDGRGGIDFLNFTLKVIEKDTDGDGVPNEDDDFPYDPAASVDLDGDGMPDKWNPGMGRSDSTSKPRLEIDPYPEDPSNKVSTEKSSKTWLWISLVVVTVTLIAVFIGIMFWSKKKALEQEEKEEDILGRVEPNDEKLD